MKERTKVGAHTRAGVEVKQHERRAPARAATGSGLSPYMQRRLREQEQQRKEKERARRKEQRKRAVSYAITRAKEALPWGEGAPEMGPRRLEVYRHYLRHGHQPAHQVAAALGMSPARVSQHYRALRDRGLLPATVHDRDLRREVFEYVVGKEPRPTGKEIGAALGIHHSTAYDTLNELMDAGALPRKRGRAASRSSKPAA